MSKAARIAERWNGDPKGLPRNVQEAIVDVAVQAETTRRLADLARTRYARLSEYADMLALEGDEREAWIRGQGGLAPDAEQPTYAYRWEEVAGEILEISVDAAGEHVRVIHRPDLTPGEREPTREDVEAEVRREVAGE